MAERIPDWLRPSQAADDGAGAPALSRHHLEVLRRLLGRDYLHRADWRFALQDLAETARQALGAEKALVALLSADDGSWSAITSSGKMVQSREISLHGSWFVLENVKKTGKPILTTHSQPLDVDSDSLRSQRVESVLAVPLFFWDASRETPDRALGGCVYAHRTSEQSPFTDGDAELMLDICRIVEPNLNLLRSLRSVQSDLDISRQEVAALRRSEAKQYSLGRYQTSDPEFADKVIGTLLRISKADRVGLLLLGPTGSGKSHLAQSYHYECPRRSGPFVTLDCSQVTSSETLSAELFGYAASSGYANAPPRGRPGKAQLADRGTLFIDEIALLPPDLQQRLLRLIQSGRFSALGSSEELQVDVQVIAATNEDLARMVEERRFREDLYWRIREITIELPPLDRRAADVPALAALFLEAARARYGRDDVSGFTDGALGVLQSSAWSRLGNIRGLELTVNRAVLLAPPGTRRIDASQLPIEAIGPRREEDLQAPPPVAVTAPKRMTDDQKKELRDLLERKIGRHKGVMTALASDPEVAGPFGYVGSMPASTLAVRLQELGLSAARDEARRGSREGLDLETVKAAIRRHGSASGAAHALGISRDSLVWRLRREGLRIGDVLGEPGRQE
ncbi:MAG: sigma 54-interacting transcriptional regulator [Acidobacteriota bacterium]